MRLPASFVFPPRRGSGRAPFPRLPRRIPWRMLARPRPLLGLLLGLLPALALWTLSGLEPWQGRVVAVPDGDTLVVRDAQGNDVRVRLYGIDAPELRQRGGEQARHALMRMAMDRPVYLVTIDRDGYGRDVAHVRTAPLPWLKADPAGATGGGNSPDRKSGNGIPQGPPDTAMPPDAAPPPATAPAFGATLSNDINGDMLRTGQAWFYGEYCRLPYPCLSWYLTASEARETGIGL